MESINNDNCIICDICGEVTINKLFCQNCHSILHNRRNTNFFSKKKINPKYDNIFTLGLKKRLKSQNGLREIMRERERKEKERREKEIYEMEQKIILEEVNEKYDNIKNDLPIPFYLSKDQLDKLIHLNNEKLHNISIKNL